MKEVCAEANASWRSTWVTVESWESIVARQATNLEVFGPSSDEVVTRGFRVNDNGVIRDISVTKAEVTTPPLAGGPMLIPRQNDSPVGYIHFRRFIDSAELSRCAMLRLFLGRTA